MKTCNHIPLVVVVFLGLIAIISLFGLIFLIYIKADTASISLVSASLAGSSSALGALLAKTERDTSFDIQLKEEKKILEDSDSSK